jgi:putative addiction module component (TIGR02574 family)
MKDPFPDIERVFELGLLLPECEREQVAQRLLDSLKGSDPEIERAWRHEVVRRMESVERGEAETIPHEQVMRELDEELRRWDRDDAIEAALKLPADDLAEIVQRLLHSLPEKLRTTAMQPLDESQTPAR